MTAARVAGSQSLRVTTWTHYRVWVGRRWAGKWQWAAIGSAWKGDHRLDEAKDRARRYSPGACIAVEYMDSGERVAIR